MKKETLLWKNGYKQLDLNIVPLVAFSSFGGYVDKTLGRFSSIQFMLMSLYERGSDKAWIEKHYNAEKKHMKLIVSVALYTNYIP